MNNSTKKILFLINDITAIGGTERMCTLIANELEQKGFEICIISFFETKALPFFILNAGIKRRQLVNTPPSSFAYLHLSSRIYRAVQQEQPSIIISCDTQMCLYSSLPLMTKKHVAWEHFNTSTVTWLGSRWFGRRMASLLCKKIVVLTESDKTQWMSTLQTNANKLSVIPNLLPVTRVVNIDNSQRKKIVLAVGRMTEQKGFDLLIEAWQKIPEQVREKWTLRIVGPNGSAKPKLEALISSYHLEQSVELIAGTANIKEEYQAASFYVLSSRYEGFGLTLIEAMGQGLAVIAFDCPMGPREIIEDKYGILLPAKDTVKLSLAIQNFMQNNQLRNNYSRLAHQRAENYTSSNIMCLWESMIQQLDKDAV